METLAVVNAEYTTNHHLGFSGVLETTDSVVDEENFGTKVGRSSAVDKEKSSIQDAFQLYVKDVDRAELLDRKQECVGPAQRVSLNVEGGAAAVRVGRIVEAHFRQGLENLIVQPKDLIEAAMGQDLDLLGGPAAR